MKELIKKIIKDHLKESEKLIEDFIIGLFKSEDLQRHMDDSTQLAVPHLDLPPYENKVTVTYREGLSYIPYRGNQELQLRVEQLEKERKVMVNMLRRFLNSEYNVDEEELEEMIKEELDK